MADATETCQRGLRQPPGLRLERYLGIAAAGAGILGLVALFGSPEALWLYTRKLLGTFYLLAMIVAS